MIAQQQIVYNNCKRAENREQLKVDIYINQKLNALTFNGSEGFQMTEQPTYALNAVVFARCREDPFWPAKIIKILPSESTIYKVAFFNHSSTAYLEAKDLLPFSPATVKKEKRAILVKMRQHKLLQKTRTMIIKGIELAQDEINAREEAVPREKERQLTLESSFEALRKRRRNQTGPHSEELTKKRKLRDEEAKHQEQIHDQKVEMLQQETSRHSLQDQNYTMEHAEYNLERKFSQLLKKQRHIKWMEKKNREERDEIESLRKSSDHLSNCLDHHESHHENKHCHNEHLNHFEVQLHMTPLTPNSSHFQQAEVSNPADTCIQADPIADLSLEAALSNAHEHSQIGRLVEIKAQEAVLGQFNNILKQVQKDEVNALQAVRSNIAVEQQILDIVHCEEGINLQQLPPQIQSEPANNSPAAISQSPEPEDQSQKYQNIQIILHSAKPDAKLEEEQDSSQIIQTIQEQSIFPQQTIQIHQPQLQEPRLSEHHSLQVRSETIQLNSDAGLLEAVVEEKVEDEAHCQNQIEVAVEAKSSSSSNAKADQIEKVCKSESVRMAKSEESFQSLKVVPFQQVFPEEDSEKPRQDLPAQHSEQILPIELAKSVPLLVEEMSEEQAIDQPLSDLHPGQQQDQLLQQCIPFFEQDNSSLIPIPAKSQEEAIQQEEEDAEVQKQEEKKKEVEVQKEQEDEQQSQEINLEKQDQEAIQIGQQEIIEEQDIIDLREAPEELQEIQEVHEDEQEEQEKIQEPSEHQQVQIQEQQEAKQDQQQAKEQYEVEAEEQLPERIEAEEQPKTEEDRMDIQDEEHVEKSQSIHSIDFLIHLCEDPNDSQEEMASAQLESNPVLDVLQRRVAAEAEITNIEEAYKAEFAAPKNYPILVGGLPVLQTRLSCAPEMLLIDILKGYLQRMVVYLSGKSHRADLLLSMGQKQILLAALTSEKLSAWGLEREGVLSAFAEVVEAYEKGADRHAWVCNYLAEYLMVKVKLDYFGFLASQTSMVDENQTHNLCFPLA